MSFKDEQETDTITEAELLAIDAVDENQEKYQSQKKSEETPPKEIDLLADNLEVKPTAASAQSGSDREPPSVSGTGSGSGGSNSDHHPASPKKGRWLPIASIVTLGLLGGLGYQAYDQLQQIKQSLTETNQKALVKLKEQDKALGESYNSLLGQVELNQKKVAEMGAQQQEIQSTLSRLTGHKEDNWLLAEALYLSRLAVERLQTTQDVKTAIAQLVAADDRLRQVADPSLMPVRKILVDKIAELQAVNAPDFQGLWLQLGTISEMADKLVPLHPDKNSLSEEPKAYPTGWKAALKQSWLEVKSLVKIRSPQENASTPVFAGKTLSELNQESLKRGFRLFIEQGRWALIQREAWLYQGSLDNAQKWLKTYFAQESTSQLMYMQLEQLKNNHIEITVPDASPAVTAIHHLIQQRQKLLVG